MLISFFLVVVVWLSLAFGKVRHDRHKGEPTPAPPGVELGSTTAELQTHTIELRYAVAKDAQGSVASLKLTAECNHFSDKMYLAIGFSRTGQMVPSFALAGWMTRPDDHDDTPVAQCRGFWLSQQSPAGVAERELADTAVDRCTMQRGYGTVAMQIDIDVATNRRLLLEAANNNSASTSIALPIDADGVRLIYAIGVAEPSRAMPLTFHNNDAGSILLSFRAVVAPKVPFIADVDVVLASHMLAMLLFAFLALARLTKPPHTIEAPFMRHHWLRIAALVGAALTVYHTQAARREHFADLHGAVGLVVVLLALAGPAAWRLVFGVHPSVSLLALLVVLAQLALGFLKMASFWLFLATSVVAVVVLLLTEAQFLAGWPNFVSRKKELHV